MPPKKTSSRKSRLKGKISPTSKGGRKRSSSKSRATKSTSKKGRLSKTAIPGFGYIHGFKLQEIPLDRWIDIVGVIIGLIGLLTILGLFYPKQGGLVSGWMNAIGDAFGWGMYLFPIGLVVCGIWLVVRKFERVPPFAVERVLGALLLFFVFLAALHFLAGIFYEISGGANAETSQEGGVVGAKISGSLDNAFGRLGTTIILAAFLLIGLVLLLDRPVAEMLGWFEPAAGRFQNWLKGVWVALTRPRRWNKNRQPGIQTISPTDGAGFGATRTGGKTIAAGTAAGDESLLYEHKNEFVTWKLPGIDEILEKSGRVEYDKSVDVQRARVIEETLASFGAPAHVVEVNRGPTITQFGVEPDFIETRSGRTRVRVNKISALADDLALALAARRIRIQAPVPGKGYVGIEVPNEETALVTLRDILESKAFTRLKSPLAFALGQNVTGNAVAADLAGMPHLLIAGATGSGKSVCVNALISCMLMNNTPGELRMIMVDPKRVELTGYNGIPHLLAPVVVELERVVRVLQWVAREMDLRYRKLAEAGCRNLQDYNHIQEASGSQKLPYLMVIIDELADLMMIAPDATERLISRLAQLARATGIHLVISTQRPSVDVVTGLIKANFPARIAFAVASGVDSRVILDQPGAERLLGQGDMLFQAPDAPAPVRLQGVFVSDMEIMRLVNYWQRQAGLGESGQPSSGSAPDAATPSLPLKQLPIWEELEAEDQDPLFGDAVDLCRCEGKASISMLQRKLRIGYTRAARLVESMEEQGIVSQPTGGTGVREVLDFGEEETSEQSE